MKHSLYAIVLSLAVANFVSAQPAPLYENDGVVNVAPQIDATSFVNNGFFTIGVFGNIISVNSGGAGSLFGSVAPELYDTSDTLNYTNNNTMSINSGFRFDTEPSGSGNNHMAANFVNIGSISAGTSTNSIFFGNFFLGTLLFSSFVSSEITVSATNLVNPGLLEVGGDGLLKLTGNNVDLSRGTTRVEGVGFQNGLVFDSGIFDLDWGVGVNSNRAGFFNLPNPSSPLEPARNVDFGPTLLSVVAQNALAYVFEQSTGPSNFTFQVVFVSSNNPPSITTDVRFDFPGDFGYPDAGFMVPVIQWLSVSPGSGFTNQLYLSDTFGGTTNLLLATNGTVGVPPAALQVTLIPTNYVLSRTYLGGPPYQSLLTANAAFDSTILANASRTNNYSIYVASLQPTTAIVDPNIAGSSITNMPGRIEITANQVLNMANSRIDGVNYLSLTATNHFAGSPGAQVVVPNSDINLGSTNGSMSISNLLSPVVPVLNGTVEAWSSRWTNVDSAGITNEFHVLLVNTLFNSTAPSTVQNLTLRSTNLFISDVVNVTGALLLDTERLTIMTNAPGSPTPSGQLNLANDIVWPASLPRLQYLTNSGTITLSGAPAAQFEGKRQPPYFTSTFTEPYQAMVNHGTISDSGNVIWANYFENTGAGANAAVISSLAGPVTLQATTANVANSAFSSPGNISIISGTLSASNHVMQANGSLTLAVTNQIGDGGATLGNIWQVGNGFNLPVKPATGDLLATTITSVAPVNARVVNTWAGEDRGVSAAGFGNNAAVGHLILDGNTNSVFAFTGTGAQNAMYVDLLELKDYATNRISPKFTGLDVDTNMTIYFADARIGSADISEKLDGANGGRFHWVPSYAGLFSSTNITYPSGRTYTFNIALVQSSTLDSDGDGIPNSADPTPIFTADNVAFSVQLTNQPPGTVLLSWESLFNSTKFLYFKSSLAATNWTVVTNFVQGPVNTRVTVADQVRAGGPGFYQVRVDAAQP